MRINEIAKEIGAPRSTVYEIADRLVKENILEVFDEEGRVFLGRKLYYFGISYAENFDLTPQGRQASEGTDRKHGRNVPVLYDGGQQIRHRHDAPWDPAF